VHLAVVPVERGRVAGLAVLDDQSVHHGAPSGDVRAPLPGALVSFAGAASAG
jgi:hypothetical protein